MPQSTLPVRPGIWVCVPRALCVIGMGMVVAVVANMPMSRGHNRVRIGKVDAFMAPWPEGVF